ncbi:MAG: ATP-binding protein [Ancalomicrobiaceae bacterium]|nr:ATP-binding protein [Ancalomicrobiaceae bacterium]
MMPTDPAGGRPGAPIDSAADIGPDAAETERESMWLEVIAKMDQVYSDLIRYETELEAKNAELEEAQDFISSVIASVSDILVVTDANGVIQQVNPAFLKLAGADDGDLVGSKLADWLAPDAAGNRPVPPGDGDAELRFRTVKGDSELMAVAVSSRHDHAGRRVGSVMTGRPIGELRRAYQALHRAHQDLQQAQRKLIEQEKMASLGRLVAGVAHELNNPISFVFGNIHTLDRYRQRLAAFLADLQRGGDAGELMAAHRVEAIFADLEPLIEGTLEGAVRISDIVRNLRRISFARPGEFEPVDIAKVARNAALWASKAKGVDAHVDVVAALPIFVGGQEGQLHQVLVNLIENALYAVRHMAEPRVRVAVAEAGDWVEVRVGDNGPGIAADIVDKIFEPFFTTKTVGEGTGLGLWISYAIAREHGGEIVALPAASGAEFLLRLPRAG